MCDEGCVARSVYKIKLCIAMFEMCECSIQRDFAGDGIFFVIGNGRPFIYLSPARCGSGDVEKRADELRLPCVAMSNDREVSDRFSRIDFHMCDSFQACDFGEEAYSSAKAKGKLRSVFSLLLPLRLSASP